MDVDTSHSSEAGSESEDTRGKRRKGEKGRGTMALRAGRARTTKVKKEEEGGGRKGAPRTQRGGAASIFDPQEGARLSHRGGGACVYGVGDQGTMDSVALGCWCIFPVEDLKCGVLQVWCTWTPPTSRCRLRARVTSRRCRPRARAQRRSGRTRMTRATAARMTVAAALPLPNRLHLRPRRREPARPPPRPLASQPGMQASWPMRMKTRSRATGDSDRTWLSDRVWTACTRAGSHFWAEGKLCSSCTRVGVMVHSCYTSSRVNIPSLDLLSMKR